MDIAQEIELKANLLVEGLRIEESALKDVGTRYKENIAWVFDYNVEEIKPGIKIPMELKLPLGTVPMVSYNSRSPYSVRKEDGTLILEKGGKFVSTIEWTERPDYYHHLTSDGAEMKKVAQIRGDCSLCVCFSNACLNWKGENQCRYCNLNAAQKIDVNKGTVLLTKKPVQVGEVAAAALEEGINFHIIISGGMLPGVRASDTAVMILESIKEHTGLEQIPGSVNIAPPMDLGEIDRVYQTGVVSAGFNLECWDLHMFQVICPGKHKNIGRETFLRALEYAVSLYGRGFVYSAFVCGLEEKEKYFEAAEYLAEKGVFALMAPWIPMVGSKLEGHRPPHTEWMLEVNERVVDIVAQAIPEILTEEFFRSGFAGCYRCQPEALFWDVIRRRLGGIEIDMPKDVHKQSGSRELPSVLF